MSTKIDELLPALIDGDRESIEQYHRYYILDEQGKPVPTTKCRALSYFFLEAEARTVATTCFVVRGVEVSIATMFRVFNAAPPNSPPVLWQTKIFTRNRRLDGRVRRYRNMDAALAGHLRTVRQAKKFLREHRFLSSRRAQVASLRKAAGWDVLRRRESRV